MAVATGSIATHGGPRTANRGTDDFERTYRYKLGPLLQSAGLLLHYDDDRAGLDGGLHLFEQSADDSRSASQVRVWYQSKGIQSATLQKNDFEKAGDYLPVSGLPINYVLYWYAMAEPVYLIYYVEAVDEFLAEDIRQLVDRDTSFAEIVDRANEGRETMTLHIRKDSTLAKALLSMPQHRSLRIDGPAFRGRPLGHRFDPLRCELSPLPPSLYRRLIRRLLEEHDFRPGESLTLDGLADHVSVEVGSFYLTFEWTNPLFTEYGVGPGDDFRVESPPMHIHGDALVVVDDTSSSPPTVEAREALGEAVRSADVSRVVVFFNGPETSAHFGAWRTVMVSVDGEPIGLGSLAFNVLVATNVYLEFMSEIKWKHVNFL